MSRRAVVVGAGITGLTAAYRLLQGAQLKGLALEVEVHEASDRAGGVIASTRRDGFLMEGGPDSLITVKPAATGLATELGLSEQLIGTTEGNRKSFVARGGELHTVPEGFYLLAPTAFLPFATSRLFTWGGKLRMALDLVIPARSQAGDETLASFVRRRLGQEALERIAQPMVGGIYTADPEQLSLAATMPQFLELERKYGSVIRGMLASGMGGGHAAKGTAGPRYGLFATLSGGLEDLVKAIAARLPPGSLKFGSRVSALAKSAAGWDVATDGGSVRADAVVVALPPPRTLEVVRGVDEELTGALEGIPASSAATLNLAYRASDVPHPLDGAGLVIPATEKTTMMALSFSSRKYARRAPDGMVLLRAFIGGALHQHVYRMDDAAIVAGVKQDVANLLGIRAEPVMTLMSRHEGAMPQYLLGHLDRVATIERRLGELAGLALAGNGYRGVGVPDCIASAAAAAAKVLAELGDGGARVRREAGVEP